MNHKEISELLKDFKTILRMSNNQAQFSLYCTLHGRAELLSERFRTFLFRLFTSSNLDKEALKLFFELKKDLAKLTSFYNDGKILLKTVQC